MKRIAVMVCAVLALVVSTGSCEASWAHLGYSGYQPWWNIFAKRYKCLTPEEERLQKFWHDYYDSLKNFYKALDAIDWVAYYKNHGYQINSCGPGGCGRINYAPVFVSPTLQWAVPASCASGPPVGPGYGPPPMMGGFPMGPGPYCGYPGAMPMPGPMYPPPPGPGAPPQGSQPSAPAAPNHGPAHAPASPLPGMGSPGTFPSTPLIPPGGNMVPSPMIPGAGH